jgi:predicted RNase H-like HicB family nuclease
MWQSVRTKTALDGGEAMGRNFTLECWNTENWYVGKLREVPGVFSQGKTLVELEENIRDAYDLMIEDEKET